MKKVLFLVVLALGVLFNSCAKDDEIDIRDKYVGNWRYLKTGKITSTGIDGLKDTKTMENDEGFVQVTKGKEDSSLIIDKTVYKVKGNKLSYSNISEIKSGISIKNTLREDKGELMDNKIVIKILSETIIKNTLNGKKSKEVINSTYTLTKVE